MVGFSDCEFAVCSRSCDLTVVGPAVTDITAKINEMNGLYLFLVTFCDIGHHSPHYFKA